MTYLQNLPELVEAIEGANFRIYDYTEEPRAFDNFAVTISNGSRTYRIVRDRSQFILEGAREEIEAAGLWRAFDSQTEFQASLTKLLKGG